MVAHMIVEKYAFRSTTTATPRSPRQRIMSAIFSGRQNSARAWLLARDTSRAGHIRD